MSLVIQISIHTPLAGSDLQSLLGLGALLGISIHTPLAGSDVTDSLEPSPVQFQSTLPLRGATFYSIQRTALYENFNPHSPCGERPAIIVERHHGGRISIHTPLAGSDSAKNGVTFGNV